MRFRIQLVAIKDDGTEHVQEIVDLMRARALKSRGGAAQPARRRRPTVV